MAEEASFGKNGKGRWSWEREVRRETVGYMPFSYHLSGRDGTTKFCVSDFQFQLINSAKGRSSRQAKWRRQEQLIVHWCCWFRRLLKTVIDSIIILRLTLFKLAHGSSTQSRRKV